MARLGKRSGTEGSGEADLSPYRRKRDFTKTDEPSGDAGVQRSESLRFVIQKHAASHLHFDLRLEYHGAFKSWAVPKGPSLDRRDRRLAMEVEDHPLEYGDFEGTIPKGQYGGGTVMLWDRGYWAPEQGFEDISRSLAKGELKFVMEGERMHGSWVLVRTRRDQRGRASWILIKHRDEGATDAADPPSDEDRSVASGRTMSEIAAGKSADVTPFMTGRGAPRAAVWQSHRGDKTEAKTEATARSAKPAAGISLPSFIEPQLARSGASPPSGLQWGHEIKFDGYRMQLRVENRRATLKTRKGLDWSDRYPEILEAGARLPEGIYDGEVVALDETGAPDFSALQAALAGKRTLDLVYFAFDLLFDGGEDLRSLPLTDRKDRLRERLRSASAGLRFVEHFVEAGDAVLMSACRMHLEGIVSKRLDAPYRSGRGETWTKSKCRAGHEVVIGGYTTTAGKFRSLIAGVNREGRLVEVGRIGTGFGQKKVAHILPKLKALATDKSPFGGKRIRSKTGEVHWVRPELVAEIEYEGFSADGLLRQAAFKALREDKPAEDVQAVEPAPKTTEPKLPSNPVRATARRGGSAAVLGVTISNAGKALWPDDGSGEPVTKLDLARYYEAVGGRLIDHIRGRPCSMIRFPDGIEGKERFFQRHVGRGQSNLMTSVTVFGDRKPYVQFDRVEALVAAAQAGALELHPWNCEPFDPETPGRLVFDLDPAPDVPFEQVIVAARDIRDLLEALGLVGFCKTTGGKGLHVVTPVDGQGVDWPTAKAFARNVCKAMASDHPDRFLINMAKAKRVGRIFLDYLRNDRMATAVAPYSPRGRPGAPVSMPVRWNQVRKGLDPSKYTIRTVPELIRKADPWHDYGDSKRPLRQVVERLAKA
ncbi:DNA ligase D [Enterovirga rhinocerotis]|uniref:DNA ligase (ATP) n=1 Tax=Enterovirga rhinocerotis TaxID=1339210 RepID=A0A4R7BM25_9HYPH|nr:DNA ligase D [Enterovirga rhinocerotis]TDR85315.1 ATP-dependent DNA ligase LigD phosphoesterase module /ATP-dependent DNA ligase LigD polymerase module [Enterovirga rhinocerotis]